MHPNELHKLQCGNPSGRTIVRFSDAQPRVRFLFCADCNFNFGVEVLDEAAPLEPHVCGEYCQHAHD